MANIQCSLKDWKTTLEKYGSSSASYVAQSPKLLEATFGVLRGVAEKNYTDAGLDAIGLSNEAAQKTRLSANTKTGIKAASFLISEAKLTMSLRVLNGAAKGAKSFSTAGIVTVVGATMITKVGQGLSMSGEDEEKAHCVGALMEVAGNVGVTAVTWETGVGAFIGLASIAASSYSAYNECRNVKF